MTSKMYSTNIKCRNECGYYGNPSWNNYCSRCYRDEYLKKANNKPSIFSPTQESSQAFSKFEAKRKKIAEKSSSTVKSVFKLNKGNGSENVPEEFVEAKNNFLNTLSKIKIVPRTDVSRRVLKLLKIINSKNVNIDQFSDIVQNFYTNIHTKIYGDNIYGDLSSEQKIELTDAIERFITIRVYRWAFAPQTSNNEEIDLQLQEKIRSLHWVTHRILGAPIDPSSPDQCLHLETAVLALINLNSSLPTESKLNDIVRCSRELFKALKINSSSKISNVTEVSTLVEDPDIVLKFISNEEPVNSSIQTTASADDFFPALIWVILRANPPLLHSNIQFIMRFANQSRLNSGESGYCFTNLCCAVYYIKSITHDSLGMSKDEFERQMVDGVSVILSPVDVPTIIPEVEQRYEDIYGRLDELNVKITRYKNGITDAHENLMNRAQEIRQLYPLKRTVKLDPRELENPHILCLGPDPTSNLNILDQFPTGKIEVPCLIPSRKK